ncbi:hypothetical protein ACTXT7_008298, partial [Hymenolepis weldensis]
MESADFLERMRSTYIGDQISKSLGEVFTIIDFDRGRVFRFCSYEKPVFETLPSWIFINGNLRLLRIEFFEHLALGSSLVFQNFEAQPVSIYLDADYLESRSTNMFLRKNVDHASYNMFIRQLSYGVDRISEHVSITTLSGLSNRTKAEMTHVTLLTLVAKFFHDTVIYERLVEDALFKEETLNHMDEFAKIGLRTLCIAFRRLDRAYYEKWAKRYYERSIAVTNRAALVDEVCEEIEQSLQLVGATAIEDKLQDDVPQTIANMLAAGISIWVLTGDKQETAVNIGLSCRLISPDQIQLVINASDMDGVREQLYDCIAEQREEIAEGRDIALIVTGKALEMLLTAEYQEQFFELAQASSSVICCRVSPWQKAEMVRLVRTFTNDITLAIGDGANDVGMIQAAHIGIGIYGVEGRQAACSSDYAIAQFRFLNKLILVHGAWSFNRITKVILYSFYKNICLYVIQFWFGMISGFSGQIIFDRWSMALYNVAFSAAPPLALGLFERNMSAKNCLRLPVLYKETQRTTTFDKVTFLTWLANGVFHSAILFWIPLCAFQHDVVYGNGQITSHLVLGNTVYTCAVLTVCLKAGLEHTAWTLFSHFAIWGSMALWFLFLIVYSHLYPTFPIGPEMVAMDTACFRSAVFWLLLIVVPIIALTRDFVWKVLRRTYSLTMREQVMICEQNGVEPEHFLQLFRPHNRFTYWIKKFTSRQIILGLMVTDPP